MKLWVSAAGALLLAAAACNEGDDPVVCTGDLRHAVRVGVVDSISGGAVTAPEVWIKAYTPQYRDSIRLTPVSAAAGLYPLAPERAGIYTVEVTAPGYVPWTRLNVVVAQDVCHVRTVEMQARMRRA
jgi:hypothetical protein